MTEEKPVLFKTIRGEVEELETTEIESFCVACEENGVTRLLLTKIPFYKDVIISSFSCEHCGNQNNEVESASPVQEQGVEISLNVKTKEDLNRQIIRTDSAKVTIPELEFEIPPGSQKGVLTTVEGIVSRAVTGLEQDQPIRRALDNELANKIEAFIQKLKQLLVEFSFTILIRDPSGNSFVENPHAPAQDPNLCITKFTRNLEETKLLRIIDQDAEELPVEHEVKEVEQEEISKDEVFSFPTNCPECHVQVETRMKVTHIPHFKEVIIMSTSCDACGNKTNEVKVGGGISAKGRQIIFRVTDPSDLTRDVLKSETCTLKLPDLEFEALMASSGGKFTTLEGLLIAVKESLLESNPFLMGDSAVANAKMKMEAFSERIDQLFKVSEPFTIILDDPAGKSFLQNFYAPDEDPEMIIKDYERTQEDDEFLGIDAMKTEDY